MGHPSSRMARAAVALVALVGCSRLHDAASPAPVAIRDPFAFAAEASPVSRPPEPAIALTASDGSGLRLAELTGRVVIDEPLAFTELHLTFVNPEDRVREGTFRIELPAGAAVSRFAMNIEGRWQEGEIVEREEARRTFEDFLHEKQDPALLEQNDGTEFSARVFPIAPRARKEIIVSYSSEVTRRAPYRLPLRGLPAIGRLDLKAMTQGIPVAEEYSEDTVPERDFVVAARDTDAGVRNGSLAAFRVRPVGASSPDPIASLLVLVDTSGSRALGFEEDVALVADLVRELARTRPDATLLVACFDQTLESIFDGPARAFGAAEIARMRARQAFGASDLEGALRWAEAQARAHRLQRVAIVTDGVATRGEVAPDALTAAAHALATAGVERLDAVASTASGDPAILHALVSAGLPRAGAVIDAAQGAIETFRRLGESVRSGLDVHVDGARFVWPTRLDGIEVGDDAVVYADVPADRPLRVRVGSNAETEVPTRRVERPLLERAIAKATIDSLLARETVEGATEPLRKRVVELSRTRRIVSPYASMLVLQTESDYERYRIDRRSLTNILTVDDAGHVAVRKPSVVLPAAPKPDDIAPAREARCSTCLLGASPSRDPLASMPRATATPAPTRGSAHGRLGGSHVMRAPALRMGASSVSGRVPPESIQYVVRLNFGRFRRCYEEGLRARPDLEGRVAIRFVIDDGGRVEEAVDAGSELADGGVIACVAAVFRSLAFPAPDQGTITVVYPIRFGRGDQPALPPSIHATPSGVHGSMALRPAPEEPLAFPPAPTNYVGPFKDVMDRIGAGATRDAIKLAFVWHQNAPGDVLALVALGEALEAAGAASAAARVYGSIVDLYPARADLRRYAGERLERIGDPSALDTAIDTYRKARDDRPDHPSGHRLLAFALLKRGDYAAAFDAALRALEVSYRPEHAAHIQRVLHEDAGLVGAAWLKADASRRDEIRERLAAHDAALEAEPTVRLVLTWETDSNDVDLHVYDGLGGHAYYGHPALANVGELYADVTTGYGPECFVVRGKRPPHLVLRTEYYRRGPMGYGMGKIEIIDHDGKGGLTFDERPFVAMTDGAVVDLGTVSNARPAQSRR